MDYDVPAELRPLPPPTLRLLAADCHPYVWAGGCDDASSVASSFGCKSTLAGQGLPMELRCGQDSGPSIATSADADGRLVALEAACLEIRLRAEKGAYETSCIPQLKGCFGESQSQGFKIACFPKRPQRDEEKATWAKYSKAFGSAVNPALREGIPDRRAAEAVEAANQLAEEFEAANQREWCSRSFG